MIPGRTLEWRQVPGQQKSRSDHTSTTIAIVLSSITVAGVHPNLVKIAPFFLESPSLFLDCHKVSRAILTVG